MKPSKKPADNAPKKSPGKIRKLPDLAGVVAAVVIVAAIFLTFQPSSPKRRSHPIPGGRGIVYEEC